MGLIISDEYFPAPRSKAIGGRSHEVNKTLPPWARSAAIGNNPAKMARTIPEREISRFTLKDAAYSFLVGALSPLLFVSALFSGCNGGSKPEEKVKQDGKPQPDGNPQPDAGPDVQPDVIAEAPPPKETGPDAPNSTHKKAWTKLMGSLMEDYANGVAVDKDGNIYVTGSTRGDLDGNKNAGKWYDIFLIKYDSSGNKLWTKQTGTTGEDGAKGVAVDGSGNIYVTGYTDGDLDGNKNAGKTDIFLVKYDSSGNKLWTKQMGTALDDGALGISVDKNGNIYVTGGTDGDLDGNRNAGGKDIFLIKFDPSGNKLWTKQMGTPTWDWSFGVAVDENGNIYVTGSTSGDLDGNKNAGGNDIFLIKYDTSGNKLWTKQMGSTGDEQAQGVVVDASGNIYVTGITAGDLDGNKNAGYYDLFLIKYDSSGNKLWTRQMGTPRFDDVKGVVVDKNGNIYVTGKTTGDLDGNKNTGDRDIFLVKFDSSGNKLWTKQMGTADWDEGDAIAIDASGNIYVTGWTDGGLDGNMNTGGSDIFLTKFTCE